MTETNGSSTGSPDTLESALQHIQQHTARINVEHYRLGRLIVELMDRKPGEISTFTHALKKLGLSVASLSRAEFLAACTAARHFSEQTCMKYGVRRLSLLVDYCRKNQLEWRVEDPGLLPIRVTNGAETSGIQAFAHCTLEDLGRAIANSCQEWQRLQRVTRADEYCVHLLKQGLLRRFAEGTAALFKAFPTHGRMHVSFRSVCVQDLGTLQAAIRECLIRMQEEKKRSVPRLLLHPVLEGRVSPQQPGPACSAALEPAARRSPGL